MEEDEESENFKVVGMSNPYVSNKETNKYRYWGLFVDSKLEGEETGTVVHRKDMITLNRIETKERNKYACS